MKQFLFCANDEGEFKKGVGEVKKYCLENDTSSTLVHIYCGSEDKELVLSRSRAIRGEFPNAAFAGVASNGEIIEGRLLPPNVLVSVIVFESSSVKVCSFENANTSPAEIGEKIKEIADSDDDVCAVELLFPGATMDSLALLDKVSECRRDITVFGGYPIGHDMENGETFVVSDKGIDANTAIAIFYSGKDLHIDANKTAGWEKLGKPFKITAANGHKLEEVENMPAFEVYEKYLKITQAGDFARDTVEFPLMIIDEEEEILRHAYGHGADGSIYLSGNVKNGLELYLTFGNPSGIFSMVNKRCEEVREFEPQVILLYSCAARKFFWDDDMVDKEIEPFGKLGSTAGFFTGGELLRKGGGKNIFEHNITLLSIAMREGEKKGIDLPVVTVDDSKIRGQAFLLKRLAQLIQSTNEDLRLMNERLHYMATIDELTGIPNRREIERRINMALDKSIDGEKGVGIIMLDVDHFKKINDLLGHDVGDRVLADIANVLKCSVDEEKGESVGRWGGEEFFMLLPEKTLEETREIAEKTRKAVEESSVEGVRRFSASFGVIHGNADSDRKKLFVEVDEALYRAKAGGRNRVEVAPDVAF